MRNVIMITVALVLTGCAARVVSTSPRTVMINAAPLQAQEAQDLATAECTKHGLHAKMTARPGFGNPRQWAFDCIP
jgi:hypothetical protein